MIISAAKAAEAADVLEVKLDGLTSSALNSAYRSKTKECHPDHHGNERLAQWARVSWAKECLTKWLKRTPSEEPPPMTGNCRACNGSGRVAVRQSGFGAPLSMVCVLCKGTGEINPEQDKYTAGD